MRSASARALGRSCPAARARLQARSGASERAGDADTVQRAGAPAARTAASAAQRAAAAVGASHLGDDEADRAGSRLVRRRSRFGAACREGRHDPRGAGRGHHHLCNGARVSLGKCRSVELTAGVGQPAAIAAPRLGSPGISRAAQVAAATDRLGRLAPVGWTATRVRNNGRRPIAPSTSRPPRVRRARASVGTRAISGVRTRTQPLAIVAGERQAARARAAACHRRSVTRPHLADLQLYARERAKNERALGPRRVHVRHDHQAVLGGNLQRGRQLARATDARVVDDVCVGQRPDPAVVFRWHAHDKEAVRLAAALWHEYPMLEQAIALGHRHMQVAARSRRHEKLRVAAEGRARAAVLRERRATRRLPSPACEGSRAHAAAHAQLAPRPKHRPGRACRGRRS